MKTFERIAKILALGLATSAVACSTAQPAPRSGASSVAAPNADFSHYRTFSFGLAEQPKEGYQVTARSLEVQRRLRAVVSKAMLARGYREDAGKTDFVIRLAAGNGEGPNPAVERATVPPAEGFIAIDIYDTATGSMVWGGSAFAEIDPAKIDDALLQRGVDHMLASFPPGHATQTASAQ